MKKVLGRLLLVIALGTMGVASVISLTGCAQSSYSKGFDEAD